MNYEEVDEMATPPVAVIIYKRPQLTRRVLEKVAESNPSKLYVIADGPKAGDPNFHKVQMARDVIEEFHWKCPVVRIYAEKNLGLRQRVLSGLDQVFDTEDQLIILEDDCIPSRSFFSFMTSALNYYSKDGRISLVSGSNPVRLKSEPELYFTEESPIWGWATWKRSWEDFRHRSPGNQWSEGQIREICSTIPGYFARRKYSNFLKQASSLDSWAIEFSAFNRLQKKLSIVSGVNLVENAGFGADSTHTKFESYVDFAEAMELEKLPKFDAFPVGSSHAQQRLRNRRRLISWLIYPLRNPRSFVARFLRYFAARLRPAK